MFEPRRRLNSLPSDRDEGILPYEPQIKLNPMQTVNYYQLVFGVTNFHVAVRNCVFFELEYFIFHKTSKKNQNFFS